MAAIRSHQKLTESLSFPLALSHYSTIALRHKKLQVLFTDCHKAIGDGDIVILPPEGTRGKQHIKKRNFHLVKGRPATSIIPVVTHGLGRVLSKGEALLVPFNSIVIYP